MRKQWVQPEIDQTKVDLLVTDAHVTPVVATLLVNRGIEAPQEALRFLSPCLGDAHSPAEMLGVKEAVAILAAAIGEHEKICVYGDYDVDGITSTCLLTDVISQLGGQVQAYLPEREADGYGINVARVDAMIDAGCSTIVTVDNGISAFAAVEAARSRQAKVIIADHHVVPESLPLAAAIVNPHQKSCPYPFKDLAGVGVTFKLAQALAAHFGRAELALKYLDLVALGTVADMVPLVGENRVLVTAGLVEMNRDPRIGIAALRGLCRIVDQVTAGHLGYLIAPRLNAAGRMGSAKEALDLLRATESLEARELATKLDGYNHRRQEIEKQMVREAIAMVEAGDWRAQPALVLSSPSWHDGVKGVACSRLVERFYRPTIMFSVHGDILKGSGRSIKQVDMHKALGRCAELMIAGGGHPMAAGVSIHAADLDTFRERFCSAVAEQLTPEKMVPQIRTDMTIRLADVNDELLADINTLAPFGLGNPMPVFTANDAYMEGACKLGGGDHVKFRTRQPENDLETVAFNVADINSVLGHFGPVDIAFQLSARTWQGRTSLQAKLVDLRLQPEAPGMNVDECWFSKIQEPTEALSREIRGGGRRVSLFPESGSSYAGQAVPAARMAGLRIMDERERPDRDEFLFSLVRRNQQTVIYVNSEQAAVEVAETLSLKLGKNAPIAYVVDGMPGELRELVATGFADKQLTTLVTSCFTLEDMSLTATNLVLYQPPLGMDIFASLCGMVQRQTVLGFLYALFSFDELRAADRSIASMCPDREALIRLYRHLDAGADVSTFPEPKIAELGMEIFAELGVFDAASTKKMDLHASRIYSRAVARRESYQEFRSMVVKLPPRRWLKHALSRRSDAPSSTLAPRL